MTTEQGVRAVLLAAALLAGCGGAKPVVEADPVIAGKRYVDKPVSLGPVRMLMKVREGTAPEDATRAPDNLELSLGFVAVNDRARVLLSNATLTYGPEVKVAEAVTRNQALGSALGCAVEGAGTMTLDYWFNATVDQKLWSCVTIGFITPGRLSADVLELRMESLNVNGESIRVLPVTFAVRVPQE